jgi:O-antigen ligase
VGWGVIGAGGLAALAVTLVFLTRLPEAPARSGSFLDQYIASIPWGVALMAAPVLLIGLFALIRTPVLIVFALAGLLPLNLVGMAGESRLLAFSKVLVDLLFFLSVASVAFAPREWREWLRSSSVGWWLSVFCGWLAFSAIQGYFAGYNLYEWMRELGWLAFWAFGIPVGIFVRDHRRMRVLMTVLVVGALVSQVASLYLLATGQRTERPEDWLGGGTYLRAPFSEGMRFVLLWAVASLFALRDRRGRSGWRTAGFAGLALILGVGLLGSLGRSLWMGTALAVAVVLALAPHDREAGFALLLALAGLGVAALGIELVDRLSAYSSGRWLSDAFAFAMALVRGESVSSTVGRQVEWQNAIRLWLQSPFVGNGIGAPYANNIYNNPDLAAFYTHNSYLNILAKTGVVGLSALIALLASSFRLALSVHRAAAASPADRVLAITIMGYLVGVLVQSVFTPTITTTDSVMFFSFVLGLSVALARGVPVAEAPA